MILGKKAAYSSVVVLLLFLFSQNVLADATCTYNNALPDSPCTPGDINANVTSDNINDTICVPGFSKTIRPPVSVTNQIKKKVMKAYGNTVHQSDSDLAADCSERKSNKAIIKVPKTSVCLDLSKCAANSDNFKCYELDHLISLELGGCPDCATNLWPQPYYPKPGAHEKDQVENYLHKALCDGDITLVDAQKIIATDWLSCFNSIKKHEPCK